MERRDFRDWIERYEHAWREPGTQELAGLFATDANYRQAPYAEPVEGLEAIEAMWEREREGPDEAFTMTAELTAVDGEVGVARVEVHYGAPAEGSYRDLWVIELREDGRARSFEEWPFAPGGREFASGEEE